MQPSSDVLDTWVKSIGGVSDRSQFSTKEEEYAISSLIQASVKIRISLSIPSGKLWFFQLALLIFRLKKQLEAEKSIEFGRKYLLQRNVFLILKFVRKYGHINQNLEDLAQAGAAGFNHGLNKFDPKKDFRLSTFVYWWIRQGVQREIQKNSRTIQLPAHIYTITKTIKEAVRDYKELERTNREPTIETLEEMTGFSSEKIKTSLASLTSMVSLDASFLADSNAPLRNIVPSNTLSTDNIILEQELKETVLSQLKQLPELQETIMSFRFGLQGPELSNSKVAELLQMNPLETKESYKKAIRTLRSKKFYKLRRYAEACFNQS